MVGANYLDALVSAGPRATAGGEVRERGLEGSSPPEWLEVIPTGLNGEEKGDGGERGKVEEKVEGEGEGHGKAKAKAREMEEYVVMMTLGQLLPMSFGPDHLTVDFAKFI